MCSAGTFLIKKTYAPVIVALLSTLLVMALTISGINIAYASTTISPEDNSKYLMNQWYFDSELSSNVGIIVSRIIIENETSHNIEGYLADSAGTRLDMVDEGTQVVLAKYVWNNTASSDWEMFGWLHDGFFKVQKPENTDSLYAIRINVGPVDYRLDDEELPSRLKSIVFVNPAWTDFKTSNGSDSLFHDSASQNVYNPETYEPKHCNYLSGMHDAYLHCTELYIKKSDEETVASVSDNEDEDNDRRKTSDRLASTTSPSEEEQKEPSYIRVGNLTLLDVQNQIVEANTFAGANFSYPLIVANDTVQGDISSEVTCDPVSGSFFLLDETTTVSCSVGNNRNETATDTFNVTVADSTAPLIAAMENVVVEGNMTGGAAVVFPIPNSTDVADARVETSCGPTSGSFFALGLAVVTCTASDDSGNNATGLFNVTVVDTVPPILLLPGELNYEADNDSGANVIFSVNATDTVDPAPVIMCNNTIGEQVESGGLFPIGVTELVCQAVDSSGNMSLTESFVIRVTIPKA